MDEFETALSEYIADQYKLDDEGFVRKIKQTGFNQGLLTPVSFDNLEDVGRWAREWCEQEQKNTWMNTKYGHQLTQLRTENQRLQRIIAKELSENDELGCEYTYVRILKDENSKLREQAEQCQGQLNMALLDKIKKLREALELTSTTRKQSYQGRSSVDIAKQALAETEGE